MSRLPYQKTLIAVCLIGFLICMALIFSGCASSTLGRGLNVGIGVAGAADFASTRYAINRGAVEANPILGQNVWRQAALKSAGVGAVIGLASLLDEKGHRVWAHVVRGAAIGVWTWAAGHNVRVAR